MTYDNLDETIEELFDLLLFRYQISLKTRLRRSGFNFDFVIFFIANVIK